jgi:hypothetical protein
MPVLYKKLPKHRKIGFIISSSSIPNRVYVERHIIHDTIFFNLNENTLDDKTNKKKHLLALLAYLSILIIGNIIKQLIHESSIYVYCSVSQPLFQRWTTLVN